MPMLPPVCPCVAFSKHGWQRYTIRAVKPRVEAVCIEGSATVITVEARVNHGVENDAG